MKKSLLKNIALVLISSMLTATLVVGGTVAYLQDTDSDVNVMTVGNVYIEQHEYQRAEGVAHDAGDMGAGNGVTEGALVPFVQGQALYPAVPKNNVSTDYSAEQNTEDLFFWGDYVYSGTAGNGLWDDNNLSNVMDKMVFVENTGKTDAYFRTIIAFECPEGMTYGVQPYTQGNELMNNVNGASYDWEEVGYVTIDGVRYWVEVATYKNILAAGNQSHPSLLQVVLTHNATNEDMELLGDTYEILVASQAVQADGFADAETALNAGFGDITTTNHPWVDGVNIPVVVEDADGLVEALESGKDVVLNDDVKIDPAGMSNAYGTTGINVKNGQTIDGNGNTLDIKGAGGTWDSGINTTGGLIKDLTVTGSFRGIFINHNSSHTEPVVLENVTIDGTTYTISCDQGAYQNFEAFDSTFNGWTSFAKTLGTARFENCKFGEGNGYAFCRPYAPTEFVGCEFEAGYRLDARASVIFTDCTIGGEDLTSENLATLVTSDTLNNASVLK
ncbi:MAG: hypothetical protein IJA99_08300 [Oscillospiraceae bacterium]|nr:hypothetical protein [Oscillospiraceae bacterium]